MVGQRQITSVAVHTPQERSQLASRPGAQRTHLLGLLTSALQSDSPLTYFVESLGNQLGADACLLLGYHLETQHLVVSRWAAGLSTQQWQISAAVPTEAAQYQHQLALSTLQALQEGDPSWSRSSENLFTLLEDQPWWPELGSQQVIPVYTMPIAEGVIVLIWRPNTTGLLPQDLTDELASLGALALHHHELQQQARRSIEQLRYVNHLKDDFLSTLSHELRTPLTSMMLAIRMLRRSDLPPERQAMYLDILEQQCSQETALVNDLLTLRNLETSSEPVSTTVINLNQFLNRLVAEQRSRFAATHLNLVFEASKGNLYIESDAAGLTRILEELLTNAHKYAEAHSEITLSLSSTDSREVIIQLSNLGSGIAPEELPYVFDKFRRGQGVTKRAIPGTGTGLALVKGLVARLKGEISVNSQPQGEGNLWETVFTLRLAGAAMAKVS